MRLLMIEKTQLDTIPRGNTVPGVNRWIIEHMSATLSDDETNHLDIPCGDGALLTAVKRFFPRTRTFGADIVDPGDSFEHNFFRVDSSRELIAGVKSKFDVITCISGVMEFDNTLSFFEKLREMIKPDGRLIVTNDNLVSVRDRILYMLFGRHRQYKLAIPHDAPTWKILPLQNLIRILSDAGFAVTKIAFVPPGNMEWLWFPLAAAIYPFQYLYLRFAERSVGQGLKSEMYPFISLLSRHYVVICTPKR